MSNQPNNAINALYQLSVRVSELDRAQLSLEQIQERINALQYSIGREGADMKLRLEITKYNDPAFWFKHGWTAGTLVIFDPDYDQYRYGVLLDNGVFVWLKADEFRFTSKTAKPLHNPGRIIVEYEQYKYATDLYQELHQEKFNPIKLKQRGITDVCNRSKA